MKTASTASAEPLPGLFSPPLLASFEVAVTVLITFVVLLRPFSPGQPAIEPETVIALMLTTFAFFLWGMTVIARGELRVPGSYAWWAILGFLLLTGWSVNRAWTDGNAQIALDNGLVILGDIMLCVMIACHFQERRRFQLLLGCLIAGLAMVIVYSLYQRWYGLGYFQAFLEHQPQNILHTVGADERMQNLFKGRVSSTRIYGSMGYPNALAGYLLMLMPVVAGMLLHTKEKASSAMAMAMRRWLFAGLFFGALWALIYSGSRGGLLTAVLLGAGILCFAQTGQQPWPLQMTPFLLCVITYQPPLA